MPRSSLHSPASLLAIVLAAVLAAASGALAAARSRLRPTPVPPNPAASASPVAGASAAPVATLMPLPSADLPVGAGCYGLERLAPLASSGPVGSPAAPVAGASPRPVASPTPAPTPTPPPDPDETTRVKVKAAGIRLDLPADWLGFVEDDLAMLEEVPELTETLAAIEASSLVFLGLDVLPGEGCVVGGNLSLYDLGEAIDPRLLALTVEAIALGLEELEEVQGDVKVTGVDLPVGEAQRLTFRFDATDDGALTPWWVRADVFTASGRTLLAAYAAPEAIADDAKPSFTAIAKSIREL